MILLILRLKSFIYLFGICRFTSSLFYLFLLLHLLGLDLPCVHILLLLRPITGGRGFFLGQINNVVLRRRHSQANHLKLHFNLRRIPTTVKVIGEIEKLSMSLRGIFRLINATNSGIIRERFGSINSKSITNVWFCSL